VVRIDPPAIAGDIGRLTTLYSRFDEAAPRPGIRRVAFAIQPDGREQLVVRHQPGGPRADPDRPDSSSNRVTAGYFETVARGRPRTARPRHADRRVAVVSEAFVRRF
jgi:hypothetical protein